MCDSWTPGQPDSTSPCMLAGFRRSFLKNVKVFAESRLSFSPEKQVNRSRATRPTLASCLRKACRLRYICEIRMPRCELYSPSPQSGFRQVQLCLSPWEPCDPAAQPCFSNWHSTSSTGPFGIAAPGKFNHLGPHVRAVKHLLGLLDFWCRLWNKDSRGWQHVQSWWVARRRRRPCQEMRNAAGFHASCPLCTRVRCNRPLSRWLSETLLCRRCPPGLR